MLVRFLLHLNYEAFTRSTFDACTKPEGNLILLKLYLNIRLWETEFVVLVELNLYFFKKYIDYWNRAFVLSLNKETHINCEIGVA